MIIDEILQNLRLLSLKDLRARLVKIEKKDPEFIKTLAKVIEPK